MGAAASLSTSSQDIATKLREECGEMPVDIGRAKVLESLYRTEKELARGRDAEAPEEIAYAAVRDIYAQISSPSTSATSDKNAEPLIQVVLKGLPDAMDTACYMYDRWPLVVDPTGNAARYLKYNGSYIMATLPNQTNPEMLRKMFLACLKHGTLMTFNFGVADCSQLENIFDPACFPAQIFDRKRCFEKSVWGPLLKPDSGEEDPAYFIPNEAFKIVVVTENPSPTAEFDSVLKRVTIGENAKELSSQGPGAGGSDEVEMLLGAKEVIKNSEELAEHAFDGELDEIKELIARGFHMDSMDSHEHTALSEAASQGHAAVVEYLLGLGADPNLCNDKGRSPLYRAAFNGHRDTVELLLNSGADPDKQDEGSGEMPRDACTDEPTQELLESWDREKTKQLLVAREAAIAKAAEERIKTAAQRELYARGKCRDELVALATAGDAETLEKKLNDLADEAEACEGRPTGTAEARDPRGNTLLSIAAWKGKVEVAELLLTRYKTLDPGDGTGTSYGDPDKYKRRVWRTNVNARDQKGWTPIQVAVFHKHKAVAQLLLDHGADPRMKNSYGKDAFELAASETPPNVKLMRWYDHELFKKDMEAKNNYAESECTLLLQAWAAEREPAANTLGLEKAAEEAKAKMEKEKEKDAGKAKGKTKGKAKGKAKAGKGCVGKKKKKGGGPAGVVKKNKAAKGTKQKKGGKKK